MPFGISFFFWHSPCNQLVKMIPFQHVAARRRWRRKTTTHRFLPPHCKSMSSQPILVPLEPHQRLRPLVIINDGVGIIALRGFFFHYSDICPGVRTTHQYVHAGDVGRVFFSFHYRRSCKGESVSNGSRNRLSFLSIAAAHTHTRTPQSPTSSWCKEERKKNLFCFQSSQTRQFIFRLELPTWMHA